MAAGYWIKLYMEILDDPKMALLPDRIWRRAIEVFLLAGKFSNDGELPDTRSLAWVMRVDEQSLENDLVELSHTGIISKTESGWFVNKFSERQAVMSDADRAARYRGKNHHQEYQQNNPVTDSDNNSSRNVTEITDNRLTESDNRKEEEKKGEPRFFFDDHRAIPLYTAVTGLFSFPSSDMPACMETFRSIWPRYRDKANTTAEAEKLLIADLKGYYAEWCSRKRADTKTPYSKASVKWLIDWARQGAIPGGAKPAQNDNQYTEAEKREIRAQLDKARAAQEASNG